MTEPHAITRARECYGLALTMADLRLLEGSCGARSGLLLRRDAAGGEHWAVTLGDRALIVVFVRRNKRIITVLPRENYVRPSHLKQGNKIRRFVLERGRARRRAARVPA